MPVMNIPPSITINISLILTLNVISIGWNTCETEGKKPPEMPKHHKENKMRRGRRNRRRRNNRRQNEVQVDGNQNRGNALQNILNRIQEIILPPPRPDVIPPMEVMQLEQVDADRCRARYGRRMTMFIAVCLIVLIIALYIWYVTEKVSFSAMFSSLFPNTSKEKSNKHGEGGYHH
ncbi:hypothetical protein TNCT_20441 [Trichonephila clavata]|uniref:Uncharacterized protein n=1 Tax=Trichonephila clavata TaxID=2740835 RepID=A0A8X6IQR4_TRICU|nr:hypothetical protein TNCT_20441 [Trichonephila clavata]